MKTSQTFSIIMSVMNMSACVVVCVIVCLCVCVCACLCGL